MSYCIDVKLNKNITREEIKDMLNEFPPELTPLSFMMDQEWGFSCQMDIYVKKDTVQKKIVLHAAYGIDYRDFLVQTIISVCKRGFHVTDIVFDW